MALRKKEARKMAMKKRIQEKSGLMALPTELLLQIVEYLVHDFAPNGCLSKIASGGQDTTAGDDPTREAISGSKGARTIKQLGQVTRLLRRVSLMSASSNLSIMMANKELNIVGMDVLFRTNTITLTSRETRDLVRRPGQLDLIRHLRIRERNPLDSFIVMQGNGKCDGLLRTLLKADELRTLHIDIEPFFVRKARIASDKYDCWTYGPGHFIHELGLEGLVVWRCTGIGTYTLVPLPSLPQAHVLGRPQRKKWLTPTLLKKITLYLPNIINPWTTVCALPTHELRDLTRRRGYPPNPYSLTWFRPTSDPANKNTPLHTLFDWLAAIRFDSVSQSRHGIDWTVGMRHSLAGTQMLGNEHMEVPEQGGSLEPGEGGPLVNHWWTTTFVAMSVRARNEVLEGRRLAARESRRGMGVWWAEGDESGAGERFRLIAM
ncbi:hypothetical protein M409DRAFT_15996 [Zasmidium cellare ATCC 36951]|uniref:Uncharacterized protein n=1 Tax=Zasmidium cellare ATCC 36951 TaxID=1080233 RepID=A0A6A6D677_ZASCE|nr:uncharacterized protein M409DRAFT_15996 [Zasmidium cellare ATCC 36951]KAF2173722.1 hypothetical protein M409DRAFT_15996 [Zasmidium cellare ATCC 36951]